MRVRNIFAALVAVASFSAHALTLPFGFGPGATPTGGGSLQITTSSLSSGAVGGAYSGSLAASGGSGTGYVYNVVSCAPNTDLWHWVDPSGALHGTPIMNESESCTYQVTDSAGTTATKTLSLAVNVSGSLAIASPTTLTIPCAANGVCSAHMIASGGLPRYLWYSATAIQSNNLCSIHWEGWINCVPTATGTISLPVTVTDQNGATVSQTETITVNNTLTLGVIDPIDQVLHLPISQVGSLYRAPLNAFGTHSTLTYSCLSSCPSWASFATQTGITYLTGTPTVSGAVEPVIQATDGTHTATATALINVQSACSTTRPGYNTDTGFFVKNGLIYDPSGYCFHMVGANETHYNGGMFGGTGNNWALSDINTVRVFAFPGETAAQIVTNATTNWIPNNISPIITQSFFPTVTLATATGYISGTTLTITSGLTGTVFVGEEVGPLGTNLLNGQTVIVSGSGSTWTLNKTPQNGSTVYSSGSPGSLTFGCFGDGTSGNPSTVCMAAGLSTWVGYQSGLSSILADSMENIANEYADGNIVTDAVWGNLYKYVSAPITAISNATTSTITVNTVSGSNPFANTPFVYPVSAGGITSAVVNVIATAGTSGAWTLTTAPALSGTYTSGGTLYGGAVGIMRGSGYKNILMIDANFGGQGFGSILNQCAGIQASDPEQNIVCSYHGYGSLDNQIQNISGIAESGGQAVVTMGSNLLYHPFEPTYPNINSNNFAGITGYVISGVTGTMSAINGTQTTTNQNVCNVVSCAVGSWNVNITGFNATGLTYGGGGTIRTTNYYQDVIANFAALKSSNVPVVIGEFAVSGNDAGGPSVGATAASVNSAGTVLTVSTMSPGSAPLLPYMIFTINGSGNCNAIGTQLTGTSGGIGTYNIINQGLNGCNSTSGPLAYNGWGPSPSNTLSSEIIASAIANGLGYMAWSPDDHNPDGSPTGSSVFNFGFGMSPISTSVCTGGAGCYATPSDLSAGGQEYMFNPRFGTNAQSQRAPTLH